MIDSKWDVRMLQVAELISTWSKDPSTKCGAVITDPLHRIVATGYNGLAQGVPDDEGVWNNREEKYEHVIHAETNAIIFSQRNLRNCSLYTWPFAPCSRCASTIIQAGILRVVAPLPIAVLAERWGDSLKRAEWMYRNSGLQYVWLSQEDINSGGLVHPVTVPTGSYTCVVSDCNELIAPEDTVCTRCGAVQPTAM